MDIQQLISADQDLLLRLNDGHTLFWDGFMWVCTSTVIWIPVAAMLLYVLFKNNKPWEAITLVLMVGLVITAADQFASSFCKPYFMRFRPAQDPQLMYLVEIVNGYRGGRYGFVYSHAANTFAIAAFVSLLIRNWRLSLMLFFWAFLNSYSRIYLGVHYPGDILFGALEGMFFAVLIYAGYYLLQKKVFKKPQYISSQYTSTGYVISDVDMLLPTFLATFFVILIGGFLVAEYLYF